MPLRERDVPKLSPCASCLRPSELFDAWGTQLCGDCVDAWLASPERKSVSKALEPFPLWQLARARGSGLPMDPVLAEAARKWVPPTEAESEAAHKQGIALWLGRMRLARSLKVAR